MSTERPIVFVSYNHRDSRYLAEFLPYLNTLQRDGLIRVWVDGKIEGGEQWQQSIANALEAASVAVIFVSQSFLSSKFIRDVELPSILRRQAAGKLVLLPIFLRPSTVDAEAIRFLDDGGVERAVKLTDSQGFGTPERTLKELDTNERGRIFVKIYERLRALADGGSRDNERNTEGTHADSDSPRPGDQRDKIKFDPMHSPEHWVGRANLVNDLTTALRGQTRLLLLLGLTGIGKTALAERIVGRLIEAGPDGPRFFHRHEFDRERAPQSFAEVALGWLEDAGVLVEADVRRDDRAILTRLANHLRGPATLILLDGVERLLSYQDGEARFADPRWIDFCRAVLADGRMHARMILTSQDRPVDLEVLASTDYSARWRSDTVRGLQEEERLEFFRRHGLAAEVGTEAAERLARLGEAYQGHPLALRVLAGEIRTRFGADVRAFWRELGGEIEEVERRLAAAAAASDESPVWRLDRLTVELERQVRRRLDLCLERLRATNPKAHLLLCIGSTYDGPVPIGWWFDQIAKEGVRRKHHARAVQALRDRLLVEDMVGPDGSSQVALHHLVHSAASAHLDRYYGDAEPAT